MISQVDQMQTMALRRAGNLMQEASQNGFLARWRQGTRGGFALEFQTPAGMNWIGPLRGSKRRALMDAIPHLETVLRSQT